MYCNLDNHSSTCVCLGYFWLFATLHNPAVSILKHTAVYTLREIPRCGKACALSYNPILPPYGREECQCI